MLKIRIHEPASGFRLWLPIPYRLCINVFFRQRLILGILNSIIQGIEKQLSILTEDTENQRLALEKKRTRLIEARSITACLDFGELRYALTRLEVHKGLVLADIQASDGTIVHIAV